MTRRHRSVLRGLLLAEFALALPFVAGTVPAELQDRATQTFTDDPGPFLLFLAVVLSLGVLKIIAAIGLFLFKRWARLPFAFVAVASLLAPFLVKVLPPEVAGVSEPALAQSLAALSTMLDGAIVTLAYASSVGGIFDRAPTLPDQGVGGAG